MHHSVLSLPLTSSLQEYVPLLVFMGVAFGISLLLMAASWWRGPKAPNTAKLSSYECGVQPFEKAHHKFDVRFYLVAILFIIFDLEMAFLFPWAVSLTKIGMFGFFSMIVFLAVLAIGFIYEWRKGALEWE